jgi:hypothetical protein
MRRQQKIENSKAYELGARVGEFGISARHHRNDDHDGRFAVPFLALYHFSSLHISWIES